MGKGDRKTAKGKRFNASYGKARPKAVAKAAGALVATVLVAFFTTGAALAPAALATAFERALP